jgi:branched-chain amino acid aminotransferase
LGLCHANSIAYRERIIEPYDALTADEVFFSATPFCIMPCTKINGQEIGKGKVGPMTKFLTDKWIEAVKCDFVEQARRWDSDAGQN